MASSLHHYRAYHLDRDGHIKRAEIVSAGSEEAALGQLRATRNGFGIEMWDRARFVGKVPPYEPGVGQDADRLTEPGSQAQGQPG